MRRHGSLHAHSEADSSASHPYARSAARKFQSSELIPFGDKLINTRLIDVAVYTGGIDACNQ